MKYKGKEYKLVTFPFDTCCEHCDLKEECRNDRVNGLMEARYKGDDNCLDNLAQSYKLVDKVGTQDTK